ncbi:MAG: Gfo/Idh/MocA family oxidoreductase [Verrucomicrobiae bacterium]|nr:Gfo/Idh/MocA family oxidoreductase [Verrucomicrobiae bacterium]
MSEQVTSERPLRVGVVGCGRISRFHTTAYQRASGVQIASVYDVNRAAAEALAKETSAVVASSLDEMVEQHGLNAVSVCTPPRFHLEHCRPFLEAGIAVLCEKPLTTSGTDARRLAALVRRRRAVFMVGFCHRFHPPILALRELLQGGALGRPVVFRVTFAGRLELAGDHRAQRALSGGGCLADNGSHAVDLFRFLSGRSVRSRRRWWGDWCSARQWKISRC